MNALYGPLAQTSKERRSAGARLQVLEWSTAISVSKLAVGGRPFTVRLFLGPIPKNPCDWATDPETVGSFVVLPPPIRPSGPSEYFMTYYELSLSESLKSKGLDGQDIEATSGYLKTNLQWRVQLVSVMYSF